MDPNPSENDPIPPVVEEMRTSPQRRRRSRSGRGSSGRGKEWWWGSSRGGSRGKTLSFQQRSERAIMALCFLFGLCVAGFAGFVIGRKAPAKAPPVAVSASAEIVPTSETEGQFAAAFSDLRAGNNRRALLGFQEIQTSQPGFYGIDFLVGYAAYFAGEPALARESFQAAIGKKELDEEASALLALIDVAKDGTDEGGDSIVDPLASAESALKHYASRRPLDPRAFCLLAEMLRSKGSYRTAGEFMTKALERTDPRFDARLIEAKMTLTRVQDERPKAVPAFSTVTSMDGPTALAAGYAALSNKRSEEGVLFLERASEFYPGFLFLELMRDQAFDEFRQDPRFEEFLKKH